MKRPWPYFRLLSLSCVCLGPSLAAPWSLPSAPCNFMRIITRHTLWAGERRACVCQTARQTARWEGEQPPKPPKMPAARSSRVRAQLGCQARRRSLRSWRNRKLKVHKVGQHTGSHWEAPRERERQTLESPGTDSLDFNFNASQGSLLPSLTQPSVRVRAGIVCRLGCVSPAPSFELRAPGFQLFVDQTPSRWPRNVLGLPGTRRRRRQKQRLRRRLRRRQRLRLSQRSEVAGWVAAAAASLGQGNATCCKTLKSQERELIPRRSLVFFGGRRRQEQEEAQETEAQKSPHLAPG